MPKGGVHLFVMENPQEFYVASHTGGGMGYNIVIVFRSTTEEGPVITLHGKHPNVFTRYPLGSKFVLQEQTPKE